MTKLAHWVIVTVVAAALSALLLMVSWNYGMTHAFGKPNIDFLQSLALVGVVGVIALIVALSREVSKG